MKLNESCNQPNQIGRGRRAEPRSQVGSSRNRRSGGGRHGDAETRSGAERPIASTPALQHSASLTSDLRPQTSVFSIRKHLAFWSLTFNGQEACFDHEQGAYYVAYLLLNPPDEPIHGVALELKAQTFFRQYPDEPCETLLIDLLTGELKPMACDVEIVERNLCADEAEGLEPLRRKIEELEAILDNDHASEPVKAEVRRELEELYAYQKRNPLAPETQAQRAVRNVRRAIRRLHENLAAAVDAQGKPNPVLRSFAEHVRRHLLVPSMRFCKVGRRRTADIGASTFTYEPPPGVSWID